jgi:hypothetical protein
MHHDFAGNRQDVEVEWDSHGAFRGMVLFDFVQTEVSNWLLSACTCKRRTNQTLSACNGRWG